MAKTKPNADKRSEVEEEAVFSIVSNTVGGVMESPFVVRASIASYVFVDSVTDIPFMGYIPLGLISSTLIRALIKSLAGTFAIGR